MKKLLAVVLVFVFVLSGVSASAAYVNVTLPQFDVTINGVVVENANRQFPLIVYKDITYVPMTYYDCRYMGLTTLWDNDTNTFSVGKGEVTAAYRDYIWQWENGKTHRADVCEFNVLVNEKPIENSKEEYPLLTFRDVTYFPLTWRFAVEEFGWKYSFDFEKGLCIESDNNYPKKLELPGISGDMATDGEYYYYNGNSGDKNVVFRVPVSDTSNPLIIYELPVESMGMSKRAGFTEREGSVYFQYTVGHSPIMSTTHYRKINKDGTVSDELPPNYQDGKHGYSEFSVKEDGIFVKGVNKYVDSGTSFTFEKDGIETVVPEPPGRVRVGRQRNGLRVEVSMPACVRVFEGKIYYTATDLDSGKDSALYCIDTETAETKKLIDGVCGFHVFKGWENEIQKDSTMILFDQNGNIHRYTEETGEIRDIEGVNGEEGLILHSAIGDYSVITVQKAVGGNRTVVKAFACYASGDASVNGAVLLDTTVGTVVIRVAESGKLCVYQYGEAPGEEKRLMVLDEKYYQPIFCSSDAVSDVVIFGDTLLYRIGEDSIYKVELE